MKYGLILSVFALTFTACNVQTQVAASSLASNASTNNGSNGTSSDVASVATVSLSWQPSAGNSGAVAYHVYRNGNLIGSTTATSYQDKSTTVGGGSYVYTITATDDSGQRSTVSNTAVISR